MEFLLLDVEMWLVVPGDIVFSCCPTRGWDMVGWGIARELEENCQVEGSPQSSLSWASEVAVKVGSLM